MKCCPAWLREDAVQAAWAAHLEGFKPDTGVQRVYRHELKHAALSLEPDWTDPETLLAHG